MREVLGSRANGDWYAYYLGLVRTAVHRGVGGP
jgi:hypothetical protein